MPPCPSAEADPTIPGPGPHTTASQPSLERPWWIAPPVVIASASPPKAPPAVMCPASRPRRRSSRTVREWPPGRAPPSVWTYPSRIPGAWLEKAQASGASWACRAITATGRPKGSSSVSSSTGSTACWRLV